MGIEESGKVSTALLDENGCRSLHDNGLGHGR